MISGTTYLSTKANALLHWQQDIIMFQANCCLCWKELWRHRQLKVRYQWVMCGVCVLDHWLIKCKRLVREKNPCVLWMRLGLLREMVLGLIRMGGCIYIWWGRRAICTSMCVESERKWKLNEMMPCEKWEVLAVCMRVIYFFLNVTWISNVLVDT